MNDILSPRARSVLLGHRQCTATNRSGERCKRAPIVGGTVCDLHGGKVPLTQKAARERLLAMVEPALDALLRFLRQAPPCEHCGRSDADRDPTVLRAAQLVLDRTGFHPTMAVEAAPPPPYLGWVPRDRLALMSEWMAEARMAMERGERQPHSLLPVSTADVDVVDAEVAEQTSEPHLG